MGTRRIARECALQILYSLDFHDTDQKEIVDFFWSQREYTHDVMEFASQIVNGTLENIEHIDDVVVKYTKNWEIGRMATIDRNILRFATYEIIYLTEIPINVVINEAVELAKKYSTAESGKFVNGILDKLKELRKDTKKPKV